MPHSGEAFWNLTWTCQVYWVCGSSTSVTNKYKHVNDIPWIYVPCTSSSARFFLSSTQMHICTYICLHNFSILGFLHCHLGLSPQNSKFAKHKKQFLLLLWLQHPVLATLGLRSGSAEGSLGLKPGCRCRCLWWPLSSPPLPGMTSSSTPTILLWMVSYMTASAVLVTYNL